jgi:hypothetical protein
MKRIALLPTLALAALFISLMAFRTANPKKKTGTPRYYYAAGQNTSLQKTYRANSNVFPLDCDRVDKMEIGKQFAAYYKSKFSKDATNYISAYGYGPFDTYEEANKARNKTIEDQNYLCKSPKCVVTIAIGFFPECE